MAIKDIPLKKFGQKMMVSSRSVNKIPDEYLKLAQNCRIFDGGLGPARGKRQLTSSTIGTSNKGGFVLNDILYQITNSSIYSIDEDTGVQTLIVALGHDTRTDILPYGNDFAIIVSEGEALQVFDGTATLITPATIPAGATGGIIEFINSNQGYTLYGIGNILYISRPIVPANPEYAYDFTNASAQNIDLKSKIVSIRVGISGVFIFTEDGRVTFIGTDSLQDIAGSPTFLSRTLGIGGIPVSNRSVTTSGDQVFYLTKNKIWNTINYIGGTDKTTIGKLSSVPIIGIDELLQGIASNQPTAEAFYNENDNTIQMHVRTNTAGFNDITLIYDMINQTFAIDKGKNYNYIVKKDEKYYGFSDINSSIYQDDVGTSMAGSPIPFKIVTQAMNQGTIKEKRYGGFFTAGVIGPFTKLDYIVKIDGGGVFSDTVEGDNFAVNGLGEIGGSPIADSPIGGGLTYNTQRQPFDRYADEGRIYQDGTRIEIEIRSTSLIQDFLVDILGVRAEQTNFIDVKSKF